MLKKIYVIDSHPFTPAQLKREYEEDRRSGYLDDISFEAWLEDRLTEAEEWYEAYVNEEEINNLLSEQQRKDLMED